MQRVDSFGIVFPERWTAIPTEQREFDKFCLRAREKWRGAPDWDRAFERRADTLLARVRHELTKTGCVLASLYIDEVLDDSVSAPRADPEVVLIAACTLGVYTKAELRTKLSLSVPVLFGAFAKKRPGVEADTRVGRVTNVVRPDVPELPAGRCVRLRRLYEPRKLGSSTERFFAESFIWPIGDDGEACCVLQFSTTNTEHSRQFSELFGAIANTFRMFEPDQPTSFDRRDSSHATPRDAILMPIAPQNCGKIAMRIRRIASSVMPEPDRTLVLLKPDTVERGLVGQVVSRFEARGLRIVAMDLRQLDTDTLARHYEEHVGKGFYDDLVSFMSRGPVVAMVIEGPEDTWEVVRTMMGATNPRSAAPGTIRGDLGILFTENLVHGSDSAESALREISIFFPTL